MTEYSKHKRDGSEWHSPPFYTGPGEYKMCLRVYANGHGNGIATHVSVYVNLMRGEHDDKLIWPFLGDITVQLVNQHRDQDHVEKILHFAVKMLLLMMMHQVGLLQEKKLSVHGVTPNSFPTLSWSPLLAPSIISRMTA